MNVQVLDTTQKRLSILGDDEIAALYSRPCFTHDERTQYFSLSQPEKEVLQDLRSVTSQAYFVLQLGYFKARHLFFTFDLDEVAEDLQYVLEHHCPTRDVLARTSIDKFTKRKQQHVILALYNYRSCRAEERQQLAAKARQAAMICAKPVYVFRALLQYMTEQRLVAPGYSFMQDTVGQALTYEQERLTTLVAHALDRTNVEDLHRLLDDAPGLYELTQLKREPRDFSASEIKRERYRGDQIRALYHLANTLLPALNISNENIKYYASPVNYYSVYKLKRLTKATVYVYLLCFVYHRYQKHHDNLMHSLIYNVRRYTDEAKAAAKDRVYEAHTEGNENLDKAGQVLKLFTDDRIAQHTPFSEVQAKAFSILERHQIDFIADHLTTHVTFDETAFQWEHMDELAHQFKRHLRPIVLAVDFAASSAQTPLMDAVHFLQTAFHKGQPLGQYPASAFPIRCISEASTRYLYAQDPQGHRRLLPDRYEFLVYRLLRNRLEAGDVFCRDSVRFRSFEDDLLDDQKWQDKEKLIHDTGLPLLKQPIRDHLAALEERLETRLAKVNQRIAPDENEHLQITKRGPQVRWTLQYPRGSESVNHPFFNGLRQVDIGSVLHFVHQHCHFMEAFEHVLGRLPNRRRTTAP